MGYSLSSSFDSDIEKATSGTSVTADWFFIMEICDKAGESSVHSKYCFKSIIKRLKNHDPLIDNKAITLLNACVNNSGINFLLEVASENFEHIFRKLLAKNLSYKVSDRLKYLLEKWSKTEFKNEPQLNLIPSLYVKLKQEGVDFSSISVTSSSEGSKKKNLGLGHGVDDLSKGIEHGILENKHVGSKKSTIETDSRLNLRKVIALYDFEAIEDNELSFSAGDIIYVLDSSDPHWWTGITEKNLNNLFPANDITKDVTNSKETAK